MTGQTRRGDWLAASAVERATSGVPELKRAAGNKNCSLLFFSSPSFIFLIAVILLFAPTFIVFLSFLPSFTHLMCDVVKLTIEIPVWFYFLTVSYEHESKCGSFASFGAVQRILKDGTSC